MEDGIPRWLQHCYKMCCEKGGHCGRQACMIRRWFHHGDIISGQVDLYMTMLLPYYMMLFILELSIIFFVSHDCVTMTVTCVTTPWQICYTFIILYNLCDCHITLSSNSCNILFYIKIFINKTLSFCTILRIPNTNPYNSYVRLGESFSNVRT